MAKRGVLAKPGDTIRCEACDAEFPVTQEWIQESVSDLKSRNEWGLIPVDGYGAKLYPGVPSELLPKISCPNCNSFGSLSLAQKPRTTVRGGTSPSVGSQDIEPANPRYAMVCPMCLGVSGKNQACFRCHGSGYVSK